ncbi:MAG: hypothetical protein K2N16_08120 [Muribaculaceae bacterium]|nr:hypothetical protein [Muribaculaceae bacterium]
MNRCILAIVAAPLAWSLGACSNDEPEYRVPTDVCYDFVTFESKDAKGSDFSLRRSGDSELINYHSGYSFDQDTVLHPGYRFIIQYKRVDGEPYTSGRITLYGYRLLDNANSQQLVGYDPQNPSEMVKPQTMTRTGQYINMQMQMSCMHAAKAKTMELAVDSSTLNSDVPELKLVYHASSPGENYTTGYASFDVSSVWDLPTCRGVKVTCRTPNGDESSIFYK